MSHRFLGCLSVLSDKLLRSFPRWCPRTVTIDELEAEFNLLQVEQLNPFLTGAEQADVQWFRIAAITDASSLPKFKNLSLLARHILLLPHSNAACECVFSQVRKTRTHFRSTMSAKTVESICVLKNRKTECYRHKYSMEALRRAKGATRKALE